jgi:hypothetical protein
MLEPCKNGARLDGATEAQQHAQAALAKGTLKTRPRKAATKAAQGYTTKD